MFLFEQSKLQKGNPSEHWVNIEKELRGGSF